MDVFTFNNQTQLPVSCEAIQALSKAVVALEEKVFDEVAIHLVDLQAISSLHQQYFDDPSPTDCISFPMDGVADQGYKVLGEVFVCPQVALDYVRANGGDAYEELSLYIIHGLLHLLQYDDIKEEKRALMRKAEEKHLRNLKDKRLLLQNPEAACY